MKREEARKLKVGDTVFYAEPVGLHGLVGGIEAPKILELTIVKVDTSSPYADDGLDIYAAGRPVLKIPYVFRNREVAMAFHVDRLRRWRDNISAALDALESSVAVEA